jgi:hypothetical protein
LIEGLGLNIFNAINDYGVKDAYKFTSLDVQAASNSNDSPSSTSTSGTSSTSTSGSGNIDIMHGYILKEMKMSNGVSKGSVDAHVKLAKGLALHFGIATKGSTLSYINSYNCVQMPRVSCDQRKQHDMFQIENLHSLHLCAYYWYTGNLQKLD